jgi:hypothetical protein
VMVTREQTTRILIGEIRGGLTFPVEINDAFAKADGELEVL